MPQSSDVERYTKYDRVVFAEMWRSAHTKTHAREFASHVFWAVLAVAFVAWNSWVGDWGWAIGFSVMALLNAYWATTDREKFEECNKATLKVVNDIAHEDGYRVVAGRRVLPPDEYVG